MTNEFSWNLDELIHSGIKGQKWGVKNGPPYPLDRETSEKVRRNASWGDQKSYLTSAEKKRISDQGEIKETLESLRRCEVSAVDWSNDLTSVNPDIHGVGRNYNCQNSATALEMRRRGYDVEARRRDDASNVGSMEKWFKDGKFTYAGDDPKDPFYQQKFSKDAISNYYNRPKLFQSKEAKQYGKFIDEVTKRQVDGFNKLETELEKQPVGSRGIVVVGWVTDDWFLNGNPKAQTNCFHAMNYYIHKDMGLIIFDSQSKRHSSYDSDDFINDMSYTCDPREYSYMRTDNLDMDPSCVEAVISRGKSK